MDGLTIIFKALSTILDKFYNITKEECTKFNLSLQIHIPNHSKISTANQS